MLRTSTPWDMIVMAEATAAPTTMFVVRKMLQYTFFLETDETKKERKPKEEDSRIQCLRRKENKNKKNDMLNAWLSLMYGWDEIDGDSPKRRTKTTKIE